MLNLPGAPQLFAHATRFSQGLGKERVGRGEIVVSLDGSGDVDKLEDALKLVGDGGSIFIKNGTYITSGFILSNSNVWLRGSGKGTILKIRDNLGSNSECLLITGSDCIIENVCADCNHTNNSFSQDGFEVIGVRNIITKCYTNDTGTNDTGIITQETADYCMFINNHVFSIALVDATSSCVVMGNILTDTAQSLSVGNRNACTGNICPNIYVFGNSNTVIGNITTEAIGDDGANNIIQNNIVA